MSEHSSNETVFKEALPVYEKALNDSGFRVNLNYNPQIQPKSNNNRKIKIIWFNPPYNIKLETNIGKSFLSMIDKYFPRSHKLYKIFNRNTIKVNYSCTKNIKTFINSHNHEILQLNESNDDKRTCNCRQKNECPMNGKCLTTNLIYEATITSDKPNQQAKKYIGLTENTFKTRFGNHKNSFNTERYKNATELSKEYWEIKKENFTPTITWNIIAQCAPFNKNTRTCKLCLREKLEIVTYKGDNLLNKRSELVSKCRHSNKYVLSRVSDSKD